MTKFTITRLKTLPGQENIAFECNLLAGKLTIASVHNVGTGGDNSYSWKSPELRDKFERQVTDELVWELVEEKLPPQLMEIPHSVIEDRVKTERLLAKSCNAIALQLGEDWSVSPGIGGTTKVSCSDGFNFRFYIASTATRCFSHRLCAIMCLLVENLHKTREEEQCRKIPDFDLRVETIADIVFVLQEKLEWMKAKLPEWRDRAALATNTVERINAAGAELAQVLDLPLNSNPLSMERSGADKRFGEIIGISIQPHCCGNTSSFELYANRISDEKLLKLIEFCKGLEGEI